MALLSTSGVGLGFVYKQLVAAERSIRCWSCRTADPADPAPLRPADEAQQRPCAAPAEDRQVCEHKCATPHTAEVWGFVGEEARLLLRGRVKMVEHKVTTAVVGPQSVLLMEMRGNELGFLNRSQTGIQSQTFIRTLKSRPLPRRPRARRAAARHRPRLPGSGRRRRRRLFGPWGACGAWRPARSWPGGRPSASTPRAAPWRATRGRRCLMSASTPTTWASSARKGTV